MAPTLTVQLEELVKLRHEPPAEVLVEALERGLAALYQESVLSLFLKKRLARRRAIQLVGLEAVQTAEQQWGAVRKDMAWGLGHG
jgi:hypothetical protein